MGGLGAAQKTGQRIVDPNHDPELIAIIQRRKKAALASGKRDFAFSAHDGSPLNQNYIAARVFPPTLKLAGIENRGQYSIRDTFITHALSAGEDPAWVAQVCGTSEQMIFKHYRGFLRGGLNGRSHGRLVAEAHQSQGEAKKSHDQAKESQGETKSGTQKPRTGGRVQIPAKVAPKLAPNEEEERESAATT